MEKLTKQGVRDLNHLQGKKHAKKELPPGQMKHMCKHRNRRSRDYGAMAGYIEECLDCGAYVDVELP